MMNFQKYLREWRWTIVVFLGIFLVAVFLRTYNLNALPIFVDEAIYIRWAQVMRAEPTLRFLPLSDGKQPLFMWSIIPLLKVFSDPLIAGRVTSALTGLGTLVGIFVLTYSLFKSRKTSLFAVGIYAISPFSVFFDRMALVDSMLSMFGVWILTFLFWVAKTKRLDLAMITGFTLGGALLTKSPALFYIILIPTTVLFSKFPGDKEARPLHLIKLAALWLVTLIIGYAMLNILRLGPNFHLITSRNQDYVFPITHILDSPKDPFLPYLDRSLEWVRTFGPSLLLLLLAVGIFSQAKKYPKEIFLLGTWALFPILVQSEFAKVFTARYIYFSIPYILMLASTAFLPIAYFSKNPALRKLMSVVFVLFAMQAFVFNYQLLTNPERAPLPRSERSGYLEEWTAGTGIREAADYLRREYLNNPDQKIVVGTEGYFGTLPDGLQAYLNDLPEITVIGTGLSFVDIPDSLVESKNTGNRTFFVANSSRLKFGKDSFESLGLKVVIEREKALRDKVMREYHTLGPRDKFYLFEVIE